MDEMLSGGMWENPPYYLTAYSIAVKHGFQGSETDFLNALSAYLHIKYSQQRPTADSDMSDEPNNWVGICTDNSNEAPEHYTDYDWICLIAGSYLFIRYSDAYPTADSDMSAAPGSGSYWIGMAQRTSNTAPTHYTDYQWAKFRGQDGSDGGDMLKSVYDTNGAEKDIFQAISDAVSTAITNLTIGTSKLEDGAVTAGKIASGAVSAVYSATIGTSWTGSAAPYSQEITVNGLLATDTPIMDMVPPDTWATAEQQIDEYSRIYKATASANKLTVYASEPTTVSITVSLKVVRK